LGIKICALCDGPVKYIGDTVNNLEILPPLGRPKSKIVEVEMPYSTKLLTQEQETYLNLTMRYITTSGVQRLTPFEFSGTSSEVVKELPRLVLPETVAPAYIEETPQAVLTVEQLRTMGAQVATMSEAERAALDVVLEGSEEGEGLEQQAQMNAMAQLQQTNVPGAANPVMMPGEEPMVGGLPVPSMTNIITPGASQPSFQEEGIVQGAGVPSQAPVIAISTNESDFIRDGLIPGGGFGMSRPVRRNPYRSFGGMGMGPMMPSVQRYSPMDGGGGGISMPSGSNLNVTITKME
jgi:hypothetical protein